MNTWYQMWGKTYQCQISNAGGWFIGVRFTKFHDFSMTFDDFSKFHDFPWLFQKILFFQVFRVFTPCGNPDESTFATIQDSSLSQYEIDVLIQGPMHRPFQILISKWLFSYWKYQHFDKESCRFSFFIRVLLTIDAKSALLQQTACGVTMMSYGDRDLGPNIIGSDNGLLPDCTKPLPESMLTYLQRCSVSISQEMLKMSLTCVLKLLIQDYRYISMGPIIGVNSSSPSAAYMHQWTGSALVQLMPCRLFGAKPLGTNFSKIWIKIQKFSFMKCIWKCRLWTLQWHHKAPRYWPLQGEFTGDSWIPCTKGK